MPDAVKQMSDHDRNIFLKAAQSGTAVRYYIRIMIVGESGVGKTCLLRRLMKEQIGDVRSTDGIHIEVKQCKINLQTQKWILTSDEDFSKTANQNEEFADCGFWDFAGQKEFYATHQTFLSTNAIYLLVVDISKECAGKTHKDMIEDEFYKVGEYIEFWLDSIHCYALPDKDSVLNSALPDTDVVLNSALPVKDGGQNCYLPDKDGVLNSDVRYEILNPPVIIIGTGIDKIEVTFYHIYIYCFLQSFVVESVRFMKKRTELKRKRFLSTLSGHEKRRHIRKSYFLSNTEPEKYATEFEDLRKTIFEVAKNIPKWGENLPTRWIVLEKEMDRYIAEEKELVISYEVAKQLAKISSFPNITLVKDYVLCTDQDGRVQLYRGIGIFNLETNGCKKLVACLSENAIAVQVWEYHNEEQHTCNTNYSNIREYLISTVNLLQRRYKMNIQYTCFFKCPEGKYYKTGGKVHCDETGENYFCPEHGSTHSPEDLRKIWWQVR
ncbi:LRRK2 [Mytilus edulis]|uniref:LRRK2 n=1 Tax=Mytilus edulis TaxID=6550 RepID=A0A8S3RXQ0_MYTED|nr:LRRK2 [Mytilus edulis]